MRHAGELDVVDVTAAAADQPGILETRHALTDGELTHGNFNLSNSSVTGLMTRRDVRPFSRSTCLEFFRHARGEISQHAVAACALEGGEAFDHRALAVEPIVLRSGHDHRVFTGHLIGEGRHCECFFHASDYVEV